MNADNEMFSHYEDEAAFDDVDPLTFPDRPIIPTQDAHFERYAQQGQYFFNEDEPDAYFEGKIDDWWIGGKRVPMDYEWDRFGEGGSMVWALTILLLLVVLGIFMLISDPAIRM